MNKMEDGFFADLYWFFFDFFVEDYCDCGNKKSRGICPLDFTVGCEESTNGEQGV